MPTQTPTTPAYVAACLPDRLRSAACLDRVHFDVPTDEQELVSVLNEAADKLEAADALLSLSAAYREAHAAHVEAVAAENAAYKANVKAPTDAARSAMEYAKQALSAALDIS